MFLAFVFLTLMAIIIAVAQFALNNNMDRNLAPAQAYAQNITQWHQAAMLYVSDIDADQGDLTTPNTTFQKPNCNTGMQAGQQWGGSGSWLLPPCVLVIPPLQPSSPQIGDRSIAFHVDRISPGYQRMEDWRSWYYKKSANEAYVITLYVDPNPAATATAQRDPGYLKPSYVAEGLKRNMGYDRSGVGVINECNPVSTTCLQFNPLGSETAAGVTTADQALRIIFNNQVPDNFTKATLLGGAGLMTRVQ